MLSACLKAHGNYFMRKDKKGVLMELMKEQTPSEAYCKATKKKTVYGNSEYGMLTSGVMLLHAVHPHTVACTQALLKHFN
jgi:hypothetical protein